jgi:hypothetical protein
MLLKAMKLRQGLRQFFFGDDETLRVGCKGAQRRFR